MLGRAKLFACDCATCAAPDAMAGLPCPQCVRRDPATGLLSDVVHGGGVIADHGVAIPDGVVRPDAPIPGPDDWRPRFWRCTQCGGAFEAQQMNATVAAGVYRPAPRELQLQEGTQPAHLLDIERWAEAYTMDLVMRVLPSPGLTAAKRAALLHGAVLAGRWHGCLAAATAQ